MTACSIFNNAVAGAYGILLSDKEKVALDAKALTIPKGYAENLRWDLILGTTGKNGSVLSWKSGNREYISDEGKLLKRSAKSGKKVKVTMKATISMGKEKQTKSFAIYVAYPEQEFQGYLFTYFEGSGPRNRDEQFRFGLSTDAVNWFALNKNQPVISSEQVSGTGGIRDPHILRGEDQKRYYLVATDMSTAKNGWGHNPGIVMLRSGDLISWQSAVIDLEKLYPARFKNVQWVWAPQTIYDPAAGRYLVYFTVKFKEDAKLDFYAAYANADFSGFINEPTLMFSPKYGAIDGDIIYKDGVYHFYYKGNTKDEKGKETANGIQQATAKSLQGPWTEDFKYLDAYSPKKIVVEGSSIFKLNDSDSYVLMYDLYTNHRYEFQRSKDLYNFSQKPESFTKNFYPRHGSVIGITDGEIKRLKEKWGETDTLNAPAAVLPGVYGDPHIAVFGNKFYIYPTTDGTEGWKSESFTCWSSKDLVKWKHEKVILDLPKDIGWAKESAWAPAIAYKNGKYYYYFSADVNIGVAVSDQPTGPFKDAIGKPLVKKGRLRGQMIDPMVFIDDDGSAYLYFGQGNCNVVKLNEDMVSYDESKIISFKPNGYNEGSFMFKRNGKYYLSWSEFDTRSPKYSVAYAVSDSPVGPFIKAEQNPILKGKGVVKGAGHHSIVKVPGKDEWYIAYHRFKIPGGNGYNRETCISPLRFDGQGHIIPVDVFEKIKPVRIPLK